MTPRAYPCEYCGAPAIVHVMHEIGSPGSAHHFCMRCAEGSDEETSQRRSLNHSAVLVALGFFLLTTSILADWLRLGHSYGFGPWQMASMVLAVVVISSGSMIRVSSLSIMGLCLLLVTLGADYVGLDGRGGFGIRQTTGLILACLTIGAGVAIGCFPGGSTQAASAHLTDGLVKDGGRSPRQGKDQHAR